MKLIDLTDLIDPQVREVLPPPVRDSPIGMGIFAPNITYEPADGAVGKDTFCQSFGCTHADLPNGEGWGAEVINDMSTHCGTHVDAPWHSGTQCEGKPARTIDQIEINELFMPGVVLDVREWAEPGCAITTDMLERAQKQTGVSDLRGHAVLMRTGQERFKVNDPEYFQYPGMTWVSTLYLTERGVRGLGTDALGWDRPFSAITADFKRTGNRKTLWDAHKAIAEREAFIVQKLVNLQALPLAGFHVGLFPLKLARCSASPARVVAFLP